MENEKSLLDGIVTLENLSNEDLTIIRRAFEDTHLEGLEARVTIEMVNRLEYKNYTPRFTPQEARIIVSALEEIEEDNDSVQRIKCEITDQIQIVSIED